MAGAHALPPHLTASPSLLSARTIQVGLLDLGSACREVGAAENCLSLKSFSNIQYSSATDKIHGEAKFVQGTGNKNRQIKQALTSPDTQLPSPVQIVKKK